MKVFYVTFSGHLNFGAWRDIMQAQGWIADLEQRYQPLVDFARDSGDMESEEASALEESIRTLRGELFDYADEQTQMALKKDQMETLLVAMFCSKEYRDDSRNIGIHSFEIHDNFYQESLERIMKKNAGL